MQWAGLALFLVGVAVASGFAVTEHWRRATLRPRGVTAVAGRAAPDLRFPGPRRLRGPLPAF
ncbi:hypothetical protein QP028_04450 [Corynebacterium suedekumii]|nr:hypothetical protein QP028_04450 [Corynebacterium suedekumii]